MTIFEEATKLHNAINNGRGNVRQVELDLKHPRQAELIVEVALAMAGVDAHIQNSGGKRHTIAMASSQYPYSRANYKIEELQEGLAAGWEKRPDGTWMKATQDPLDLTLVSSLYPNEPHRISMEGILEDAPGEEGVSLIKMGEEMGIMMPDDAAMNEFASTVGFTSPVRAR